MIDALPLRMVIADDGLALLPVLSAPERASAAAMLVRPSALLTGLIALFDTLWTRAAPSSSTRRPVCPSSGRGRPPPTGPAHPDGASAG
ncbi:hypothetical protein [Isoptericola jiangsuensis]|uniref:hypothetical protein n=1 Tax=Isoptericola jiangsuensis TaxID=548579 RepID=UPI000BF89890|nr:hypothetical protein [Isoptericola jiangsuensis]